jgi:hypothetical protein
MQTSLTQSTVGVKPIVIESLPWSWGFECALKGGSLYDGYQFWCGARFLEWERGFNAGLALAARIEARVRAEVRSQLQGGHEDMLEAFADVELGASYCKPGIDWDAVEEDRIGD